MGQGFRIDVSFTGLRQAVDHLHKVVDYVNKDSKKDVTVGAFNAAGSVFERNFISEGSGFGLGGWADLEESTVRKREAAGFGGEHPILTRYHDLRQITATSLRVADASGTFAATDADGKTIRVSLNISGTGNSFAQATGDKAWNQVQTSNHPARPFWFTTKTVQNAIRKGAVETLADKIERL